jgi:serine protease AprX
MLQGIGWVLANKARYNIRVASMSFGAPAQGSYTTDLLAAGAEVLWRNGVVVVAAAGNGGPNSGTVDSPGIDPHVITVGSTDDHGVVDITQSTLGSWSAWGTPADSIAKPDLVSPGRKIVSAYVPGSTLANRLSDHLVMASNGSPYFRLSGTSPSTAVVSGAVALLLENQPALKPDQVKTIMMGTTQPFGQASPPPPSGAAGTGLLNAQAATYSLLRAAANQGIRDADALADTLYPALYGQQLRWKNPNYLAINWLLYTWPTLTWDNIAWDNIAWDNIAWDNIAWDNIAWDNIAWDNIAWDNIAWD